MGTARLGGAAGAAGAASGAGRQLGAGGDGRQLGAGGAGFRQLGAGGQLAVLAERIRPVDLAGAGSTGSRLVPVLPALAGVLPDGGLRRGSTVAVDPVAVGGSVAAATSLVVALVAGASAAGSWCALVGMPDLGLAAACEMGADLSRVALVPAPGRSLTSVVAALLDAVDLVLVAPRARVGAGDARRLAARARERGTVLLVHAGQGWPAPADLRLTVVRAEWQGLGQGAGRLTSRLAELEVSGRGAATRGRRTVLWLPSPAGVVEAVEPGAAARFAGTDPETLPAPVIQMAGAG